MPTSGCERFMVRRSWPEAGLSSGQICPAPAPCQSAVPGRAPSDYDPALERPPILRGSVKRHSLSIEDHTPLFAVARSGVVCRALDRWLVGGRATAQRRCTGWRHRRARAIVVGKQNSGRQAQKERRSDQDRHHRMMPFWAWRRFSASSKTTDCGPSKTSAVISSSRCAGRQCMKMASSAACAINSDVT